MALVIETRLFYRNVARVSHLGGTSGGYYVIIGLALALPLGSATAAQTLSGVPSAAKPTLPVGAPP